MKNVIENLKLNNYLVITKEEKECNLCQKNA